VARPALVAYISGHGFGHFTRSEAVLSLLAPRYAIHVRTNERALLLARRATWAASVTEVDVGPGVAQRGPLETDVAATERALARHVEGFEPLVAREASAIEDVEAVGVYSDVAPVAFEAAARARVPSVGLGNFTWSWIYEELGPCARFAPRLARAESEATRFLALPFSAGMEHFRRREDLPLVARAPTRSRADARRLLGLRAGEMRPVVLLGFGGFGDELDLGDAARANPEFVFVSFAKSSVAAENLITFPHDHDLPHQDLVLASDAILGKPGYGTVAEAIAARRPFIITPRGDFREYPVLVRGIEENLPSSRLGLEDLLAGRWSVAIRQALGAIDPGARLGLDGAEVAARRVVEASDGLS
jgi:L-arabinokinase